jgi:hypothetical protein
MDEIQTKHLLATNLQYYHHAKLLSNVSCFGVSVSGIPASLVPTLAVPMATNCCDTTAYVTFEDYCKQLPTR